MTVGLSVVNLANAWLNTMRGGGNGVSFTAPAALYVQLHVGDPGGAGTANVSAGSTTRVAVTEGAAAGGAIAQSGTSPAWTNGGTSETLTHISVWSAATGGTFYFSVLLSSSQPWASGNAFTLTALGITLTPLAA